MKTPYANLGGSDACRRGLLADPREGHRAGSSASVRLPQYVSRASTEKARALSPLLFTTPAPPGGSPTNGWTQSPVATALGGSRKTPVPAGTAQLRKQRSLPTGVTNGSDRPEAEGRCSRFKIANRKGENERGVRPVQLGGGCSFWQTLLSTGCGQSLGSPPVKTPPRRSLRPKPVSRPISPPRPSGRMRRKIALLPAAAATSGRSTEGLRDRS